MIDRAIFYKAVRTSLFHGDLDQKQVDGMNRILDYWEQHVKDPMMAKLGYVLATGYWEARVSPLWKAEFQPVEEVGHGAGHAYGNPDPTTGLVYYGRGLVQLTWIDNYRKAGTLVGEDLVHHPEIALDPVISVKVLVEGMVLGMFTGKALKDYFTASGLADWYNARRIINGTDKAQEIAEIGQKFFVALQAAT